MITLVSSPKQHLPKDMQHSVYDSILHWVGKLIMNKTEKAIQPVAK